jgi:cytochrome c oxidase cbb3-type subunit 2
LYDNILDGKNTADKMRALASVGVPYTEEDIAGAAAAVKGVSEMDALVAYLQNLGILLREKR